MIRRHVTTLRLALMSADAAIAVAVFLVAATIRFGDASPDAIWQAVGVAPGTVAIVYALSWVGILWLQGMYRLRARWSIRSELIDILRAVIILAVGTFAVLFVLKLIDVSRLFLSLLFVTQPLVTFVTRVAMRLFFGWIRQRGMNQRFLLVVGAGAEADRFADRIERHRELGLSVIGHLSAGESEPNVRRPILGDIQRIEEILHRRVVDEVAVCLPPAAWHLVEPVTRICEEEGKIVRIPLDAIGPALTGGHLEEFEGSPVLSLLYGPDRVLGLALKRILDVAISAAGLVVLSPVLLVVALWVRAADGPPVLFRQMRVGLHGRPFTLLKFRTMVPDAEARLSELEQHNEIRGNAFKLSDDPRLTRTGRFLRRTSLDELPQLWNVLKGEMSLVGPRPPLPREVAGYDIWHRRRLSMKPGITGLWQVGARREPDFDRWVEIDLDYIDRWSIWLDLKIMLRTIPAMILGQGR
ncbi:MAG TPA: sugar transferase [Candidatus Limnocylindrales bacterium]|nr:sugar transferase [Candidatus Limnocylindrales bacterium]